MSRFRCPECGGREFSVWTHGDGVPSFECRRCRERWPLDDVDPDAESRGAS